MSTATIIYSLILYYKELAWGYVFIGTHYGDKNSFEEKHLPANVRSSVNNTLKNTQQ
jgi:hypothetical protein